MNATITVIHITWWPILRILFLFFHWQRPKRPQSLFFFYTHVTRFSVGVCISRQAELLANDLSHSVLRLWFHCYLRALLPPGSAWRKSPRPKSVSHNFCLEWIELMGKPAVGWQGHLEQPIHILCGLHQMHVVLLPAVGYGVGIPLYKCLLWTWFVNCWNTGNLSLLLGFPIGTAKTTNQPTGLFYIW